LDGSDALSRRASNEILQVREVWIYLAGIRVDDACRDLAAGLLSAKKALALAVEAADRAPPTTPARPLLEAILNLLEASVDELTRSQRILCGGEAGP
jgi:hypothetical protein